jgi:putative ATP-binding cassette transporter
MKKEKVMNDPNLSDHYIQPRYYTIWPLLKLYWQSEHKTRAYMAVIITTLMSMGLVAFDVAFSYWSNYFYDALQAYNKTAAIYLLFLFFAMAAVFIVLAVYRYYISQLFGLRWRAWLTQQFIGRWLQNRDYYYMETFDPQTDNPDQRLQEDVGALVTNSIALFIGIITSVTTFFAFIYVLWELSGTIHLSLGRFGMLNIPGYLVWVAVIYALVGTYFTFKIGRPLVSLNFEQQRREANFRFAAIDLRSHAEHVALYQGELHQKNILYRLFSGVLDNWYLIILRQKLLLWFTAGYNQTAVAVPLLVALPNYFGKVFKLGGLMQSLRAFNSIQEALSFLVNAFPQVAEWRAISQRLTTFLNHLQDIDIKARTENHLVRKTHAENKIVVRDVSISTLHSPLLKNINETFIHGKNYLIKGPSGIGKSTFIRTLAGIWPLASGEIFMPDKKRFLYLSQKPYMPIGTLAEAMLFPNHTDISLKEKLPAILEDCHLPQFISRLEETTTWSEHLSPGEQQRIAFARILLQEPDWVFLDESTSMLDLANEQAMYERLSQKLPHCTIISVGHRPSLDIYHDEVIDLTKYTAF